VRSKVDSKLFDKVLSSQQVLCIIPDLCWPQRLPGIFDLNPMIIGHTCRFALSLVTVVLLTACAASSPRTEENAWESAKRSNTTDSYVSFLEKFPNGTHASEARKRLLESARQSKNEANAKGPSKDDPKRAEPRQQFKQEDDDKAYGWAIQRETYESLSRYVEAFPQGRHVTDIQGRLSDYGWETLKAPWLLTWKQLGKREPLTSEHLLKREAEEQKKNGNILKGCSKDKRLVALDRIQFAEESSRFPGGPTVRIVSVTLSVTDSDNVYTLEPEEPSCVTYFGFDAFISVGSRFHVRETRTRNGDVDQIRFFGYFARKGEVLIVPEGIRFEPGSVVLRRRNS